MKNDTPLVVNATDSPTKLENPDKKQEISITEEKTTAAQSTLETKEVVKTQKRKSRRRIISKRICCAS